MSSKILIIYEYQILFEILTEIEENLNFKIFNSNKKNFSKLKINKNDNCIVVSSKKHSDNDKFIVIKDKPIKINKFIELININFLKKNFAKNSQIKIGKYNLDLNSRKIIFEKKFLNLTEREADLIIFINSHESVSIKELQNNVWGYSSDLETHTVETHIYRLRKKMSDTFSDENFIKNTEKGYKII